jgi:hypothetical protein
MPIRNGKEYLIQHFCNCGKFYSNKEFSYKCSGCWNYCAKNGIMTSKEFGDKCNKWANDNIIDEIGRKFILKNKNISDQHLYNLLTKILENTGKYITADTGLKLFKARPTNSRGHIVGSFIADWWEIKSKNIPEDKKWPTFMECYYGNYGEDILKWPGVNHVSIPPKKPRGPKNDFINYAVIWATRNC